MLRIVKPKQQIDDGRFPATGDTRQCDSPSNRNLECCVFEREITVAGIRKRDILEPYPVGKSRPLDRSDRIEHTRFGRENRIYPLCSGDRFLNRAKLFRSPVNRIIRAPDQDNEHAQRTDCQHPFACPPDTEKQHHSDQQILGERYQIEKADHTQFGERIALEPVAAHVIHPPTGIVAPMENLHNRHPVQEFRQRGGHLRRLLADGIKARRGGLGEYRNHDRQHRQNADQKEHQPPTVIRHHRECPANQQYIANQRHRGGGEQLPQHLRIRFHPRHQTADRVPIEKRDILRQDMIEQPLLQFHHHILPDRLQFDPLYILQQQVNELNDRDSDCRDNQPGIVTRREVDIERPFEQHRPDQRQHGRRRQQAECDQERLSALGQQRQ